MTDFTSLVRGCSFPRVSKILGQTARFAVPLCCVSAMICSNARAHHASSSVTSPAANERIDETKPACRIIYLGFVGALEPAENKHSGVVQIRETLQGKDYPDVCAASYSPYSWTEGRDWLLAHFPAHSGVLTPAELQAAPKVILVGHSMGGWAMISVARELRDRGIPVELTIQLDSVGVTDYTVPRNVKNTAIFHARDFLMLITTKHVRMEDPSHTNLIADITVAGAGHQSITRDPRIRALVMNSVETLRAAFASDLHPALRGASNQSN